MQIILAFIVALILTPIAFIAYPQAKAFLTSEQTAASVQVLREKSEAKLADTAGTGDVALRMHKEQFAALKEQLVKIKSLRIGNQRRTVSTVAASKEARSKGQEELADRLLEQARLYEQQVAALSAKESAASQTLMDYGKLYEAKCAVIRLKQDEIASLNASTAISNQGPISDRLEVIRQLEEQLQKQADRAKAAMEVAETTGASNTGLPGGQSPSTQSSKIFPR